MMLKNTTHVQIYCLSIFGLLPFMCVYGNGDFHYYCFVLSLALKGGNHDVMERIISSSLLTIFCQPQEYYHGNYQKNICALVNEISAIHNHLVALSEANGTGAYNHSF
jgi:hypothetical protein